MNEKASWAPISCQLDQAGLVSWSFPYLHQTWWWVQLFLILSSVFSLCFEALRNYAWLHFLTLMKKNLEIYRIIIKKKKHFLIHFTKNKDFPLKVIVFCSMFWSTKKASMIVPFWHIQEQFPYFQERFSENYLLSKWKRY